ncbi:uncharacterized protein LOC132202337 [Neocloeon triangulifer]|uniref:uncharacterized protein LOC132202337 n=1 Tax=Neocloeon triangulifer TaxID=2078957 RepID=UPI00286ECDEA|nr:uncharacterized protein LOC132202337 [Neocloeon triangulifer]
MEPNHRFELGRYPGQGFPPQHAIDFSAISTARQHAAAAAGLRQPFYQQPCTVATINGMPYESQQVKMYEYFRTVALQGQPTPAVPQPPAPVHHPVAKPAIFCPAPVKETEAPNNSSPFSDMGLREIAKHFDVYVSEAVLAEAESQLSNKHLCNSKKVARYLLLQIIGEDVILTQTASGGRLYKSADHNILYCVEALVNSRIREREKHVNIFKLYTNLSNYLREKRKKKVLSKTSAPKAPKPPQTSPLENSSYLKRVLESIPAPQTFESSWGQPPAAKRAFVPPPVVQQQQMYSPYAQGMSIVSQPHWEQYYWHPQQAATYCPASNMPPPTSPHSLETPSMSSGSSEISSPSKLGSPDSVRLEICDDLEATEVQPEEVMASAAGSQGSNQQFSQEFWDYQSQQYYES